MNVEQSSDLLTGINYAYPDVPEISIAHTTSVYNLGCIILYDYKTLLAWFDSKDNQYPFVTVFLNPQKALEYAHQMILSWCKTQETLKDCKLKHHFIEYDQGEFLIPSGKLLPTIASAKTEFRREALCLESAGVRFPLTQVILSASNYPNQEIPFAAKYLQPVSIN